MTDTFRHIWANHDQHKHKTYQVEEAAPNKHQNKQEKQERENNNAVIDENVDCREYLLSSRRFVVKFFDAFQLFLFNFGKVRPD